MPSRPDISLPVSLATATLAIGIYSRGLPSSADIRVGEPGDDTIETVRKQNLWMAAAAVAGIALISKDETVFVVGGLTVVAMDIFTRINNYSNPVTNAVDDGLSFVSSLPGGGGGTEATTEQDSYAHLMAVP